MRAVYADTGYWVALIDESDALHPRAVAIDEAYRDWPFVSSDFVLSETVTLLRRRSETQKASDFGRRLISTLGFEPLKLRVVYQIKAAFHP